MDSLHSNLHVTRHNAWHCGGEPERAYAQTVCCMPLLKCGAEFGLSERLSRFGEWQVAEGGPLSTLNNFVVRL